MSSCTARFISPTLRLRMSTMRGVSYSNRKAASTEQNPAMAAPAAAPRRAPARPGPARPRHPPPRCAPEPRPGGPASPGRPRRRGRARKGAARARGRHDRPLGYERRPQTAGDRATVGRGEPLSGMGPVGEGRPPPWGQMISPQESGEGVMTPSRRRVRTSEPRSGGRALPGRSDQGGRVTRPRLRGAGPGRRVGGGGREYE